MPFSFRLDAKTGARLRRFATLSGQSKSSIVRDALWSYEPDGPQEAGHSAFDRLRGYIGTVTSNGAQFSHDTHAKYRALLDRKHRGRRPR